MQNKVLPQSEVDKMREVIGNINEVIRNHDKLKPRFEDVGNQLIRIHTLLYMTGAKELICSAKTLERLFDCTPEELVALVTNEGEITIEEAEKNLMIHALVDIMG